MGDSEEEPEGPIKKLNRKLHTRRQRPGKPRKPRKKACSNCTLSLRAVAYIECVECPANICMPCFQLGCEMGDHEREHSYRIVDGLCNFQFPDQFHDIDQSGIIQAAHKNKLGNWNDYLAESEDKDITKEKICKYYDKVFIGGVIGQFAVTEGYWQRDRHKYKEHGTLKKLMEDETHENPLIYSLYLAAMRWKKHLKWKPNDKNLEQKIRVVCNSYINYQFNIEGRELLGSLNDDYFFGGELNMPKPILLSSEFEQREIDEAEEYRTKLNKTAEIYELFEEARRIEKDLITEHLLKGHLNVVPYDMQLEIEIPDEPGSSKEAGAKVLKELPRVSRLSAIKKNNRLFLIQSDSSESSDVFYTPPQTTPNTSPIQTPLKIVLKKSEKGDYVVAKSTMTPDDDEKSKSVHPRRGSKRPLNGQSASSSDETQQEDSAEDGEEEQQVNGYEVGPAESSSVNKNSLSNGYREHNGTNGIGHLPGEEDNDSNSEYASAVENDEDSRDADDEDGNDENGENEEEKEEEEEEDEEQDDEEEEGEENETLVQSEEEEEEGESDGEQGEDEEEGEGPSFESDGEEGGEDDEEEEGDDEQEGEEQEDEEDEDGNETLKDDEEEQDEEEGEDIEEEDDEPVVYKKRGRPRKHVKYTYDDEDERSPPPPVRERPKRGRKPKIVQQEEGYEETKKNPRINAMNNVIRMKKQRRKRRPQKSKRLRRLEAFHKRETIKALKREKEFEKFADIMTLEDVKNLRNETQNLSLFNCGARRPPPKYRADDLLFLAYNPNRNEFEVESFNDAETIISELQLGPHSASHPKTVMEHNAKFARIHRYNRALHVRNARKNAINEHDKITEFIEFMKAMTLEKRKATEVVKDKTHEERLLARSQQTLDKVEYEMFTTKWEKFKELREKIQKLQELQGEGVTTLKGVDLTYSKKKNKARKNSEALKKADARFKAFQRQQLKLYAPVDE